MSFIEVHPDLRRTNYLLDRIARALERQLFEEHKVRLGHMTEPAQDPNPREKPTVSYATDEDTQRRELERIGRVIRQQATESEEETQAWHDTEGVDR